MYLELLKQKLEAFQHPNVDSIISEYNRFYLMAEKNGESDEAILKKLGSPEEVAVSYIMDLEKDVSQESHKEKYSKETIDETEYSRTKSTLLWIFNTIFVMVPYIALWIVFASFYLVGGAFVLVGISSIMMMTMKNYVFYEQLALIGITLASTSLGLLIIILLNSLSHGLKQLTSKYIRFNKHLAKR